jgi:hypothetical protein
MSLYQEAKASFQSLIQQGALVFVGFATMLLLTGGNPSALIVGLSFSLGVGFVAWSEAKRLEKLADNPEAKVTDSSEIKEIQQLETLTNSPTTNVIQKDDNNKESLIQEIISQKAIGRNLQGANLSGANLSRADLSGANLSEADLSRADLSGANLSEADLSGANLSEANLSRADLFEANLSRADLFGADLFGANVQNARFGYNQGISQSMKQNLIKRGAIFDDSLGSGYRTKIRV